MSTIITQHPSIIHAQDIQDICSPLQHLDITYFGHAHICEGNQFSAASTNPNFFEHYLKNEYYNADLHTVDLGQLDNFIVWDTIQLDGLSKMMDEESLAFGVCHTFTIVDHTATEKNYYHFATHLDKPSINQSYFTNIDLLQKFIAHFKEQIANSKSLSKIYQVQYDLESNFSLPLSPPHFIANGEKRKAFLNQLLNNHKKSAKPARPLLEEKEMVSYFLKTNNIHLTSRECDCLLLTLTGKTAKQTAYYLNISSRTVEEYLNSVKIKFGVYSKAQLIEKVVFYLSCINSNSVYRID